jgi:hypothetical protein
VNYDEITNTTIDQAMYLGPVKKNWYPKHTLDIFTEWDKKYLEEYRQPFSPFVFAKNCSALHQAGIESSNRETFLRQAEYLDLIASQNIERNSFGSFVRNEFEFSIFWGKIPNPFYGAFMNAYTAYGYIKLYELTEDRKHKETATNLLASIFKKNDTIELSGRDSHNALWLYEYSFAPLEQDIEHFKSIGAEFKSESATGIRVYNGHIHALLALLKFKTTFHDAVFDNEIFEALETIKKHLPTQLIEGKFFSYAVEAPAVPDYGQLRAVQLAKTISKIFPSEEMEETFKKFESFYNKSVKGSEKAIYEKYRQEARKIYLPTGKNQTNNSLEPEPQTTEKIQT